MAKKQATSGIEELGFDAPKLHEVKPVDQPMQPTEPSQAASATTEEEPKRASNVTLSVKAWEWIDAKHAEARSKGGKQFRKAAIIQAVFDAVMTLDADLAGAESEEEIAQRLSRAMKQ